MQSHNANAPVFVRREVAQRDAFKKQQNTKEHKIQSQYLYVFVGYVDKRGKKRKRERKKIKKRKVQREKGRRIASYRAGQPEK